MFVQQRDLMDHTREVPIGATERIRIVCKETLQSLVTTFTNMELEIRVKRFTRTIEAIADYVGREYIVKK
jgi:ADP-dependent phosphofructokinase/glucokinase